MEDTWNRSKVLMVAAFSIGAAITATITLIAKIKAEAKLREKIDRLTGHIEQLKRDVDEIRITSQRGSPRTLSTWEHLTSSGKYEHPSADIMDSKTADNHSSSDNEEFYDFTDG